MVKNLCTRKRVSKPNKCKKVRGCKVASGPKRSFCRKSRNKARKTKKIGGGRRRRTRRRRTRRRGGSADAELAYPTGESMRSIPNPHLAYTGTGGSGSYGGSTVVPFVGKPWGASIENWPGVSGAHDGNYYSSNTYDVQPEMNPIDERVTNQYQFRGGRRRKTRRMRKGKGRSAKRGGGLFNNNILQTIGHDFQNAYSQFNGEGGQPNPLPYVDQVHYGNRAEDNINYLKTKITGE